MQFHWKNFGLLYPVVLISDFSFKAEKHNAFCFAEILG